MSSHDALDDDLPLPPKKTSSLEQILAMDSSLEDLSRGTQARLRTFVHPVEVQNLRAVCRTIQEAVRPVSMQLYVFGGFDGNQLLTSVEHMDPRCGGTWEMLPQCLPSRLCAAVCVSHRGRLYIMGGIANSHGVGPADAAIKPWAGSFDPYFGSWESLPALCTGRAGPAAGVIEGWLVVAGGTHKSGYVDSAERFHLEGGSGEWESLPAMSTKRTGSAYGVLQGKMYVCGGSNGEEVGLASAEYFDMALGKWCSAPSMVEARFGPASVVHGACLYACGGVNGGCDQPNLCSVERLDVQCNGWEMLPCMTQRRFAGAAAAVAGCIYVCGGNANAIMAPGPRLDSVERYIIEEGRWESIASLSTARGALMCAAMLAPSSKLI